MATIGIDQADAKIAELTANLAEFIAMQDSDFWKGLGTALKTDAADRTPPQRYIVYMHNKLEKAIDWHRTRLSLLTDARAAWPQGTVDNSVDDDFPADAGTL